MSPFRTTLLITTLGGLVPATWFLIVARRLLTTKRDPQLGFILWAMPAVICLLYLRALIANVFLQLVEDYPPLAAFIVSIVGGWLINLLLWAKLIVFLRRSRNRKEN